MSAHVSSPANPDKIYPGRVLSVGQVDPNTNLLSVRIEVANPERSLRSGTFATAQIVVQTLPKTVVVPKSAVVTQEDKQLVYTVGKDGVAHAQQVTTGPDLEEGKKVALLKGLEADTPVVIKGNYELTDGAKTKPAEANENSENKSENKSEEQKDEHKDSTKAVDGEKK